jgi:hypothetical protein
MLVIANEVYGRIPEIKPVTGRELNALTPESAAILAVGLWEEQMLKVRKPTQAQFCACFHILPAHFAAVRHADEQERQDLLAGRKTFHDLWLSYLRKLGHGRTNGSGHVETLFETVMRSPLDDDELVAIGHIVGKERLLQAAVAVEAAEESSNN